MRRRLDQAMASTSRALAAFVILGLGFARCGPASQGERSGSTIANDSAVLNLSSDSPQEFLAFVGQKVSVEEYEPKLDSGEVAFDHAFRATYQVLDVVFGVYPRAEISFRAFDHYGYPEFARYDTVMLYLTRYDNIWVHEKYQFDRVHFTADRRWAGCGDPYQHEPDVHRGKLAARPITFSPPVVESIGHLSTSAIDSQYPRAFYDRSGTTVTCKAGAYAEDLLQIKREGVFRARGVFQ